MKIPAFFIEKTSATFVNSIGQVWCLIIGVLITGGWNFPYYLINGVVLINKGGENFAKPLAIWEFKRNSIIVIFQVVKIPK